MNNKLEILKLKIDGNVSHGNNGIIVIHVPIDKPIGK